MMAHDAPRDGIQLASSLKAGVCEHGTVTFELIDANGRCFARASMSPLHFSDLMDRVFDGLEAFGFIAPRDTRQ
jgi:hypothetical protein